MLHTSPPTYSSFLLFHELFRAQSSPILTPPFIVFTIYVKASQKTPATLIIESASYQVTRVSDQKVVIPYGTGSSNNNYSLLSYDVSGNYFDLDMKLFEPGYQYNLQYL